MGNIFSGCKSAKVEPPPPMNTSTAKESEDTARLVLPMRPELRKPHCKFRVGDWFVGALHEAG